MSLITELMNALQVLPGVGPKTAQRLTFHLLQKNKSGGKHLAEVLLKSIETVGECSSCRTLTENETCKICANPNRKATQVCVVESPTDIIQIEQATDFTGKYFVLHGKLSPIDELIIATGSTVEGETTAQYLSHIAEKGGIKASRLAHGVPLGGDLEYIDNSTLAHAFFSRTSI